MKRLPTLWLLVPLALPFAGACSDVDAEAVDAEVRGLLDTARTELSEGRAAIEEALQGEARERFTTLVTELEEAALRLGEDHIDELRELLSSERGGLQQVLDTLEERGAEAWEATRGELEDGAERLSGLLDRWAAELDAREAAASDEVGEPGEAGAAGAEAPEAPRSTKVH